MPRGEEGGLSWRVPSARVALGVSALGASGAYAAALSGGGRRWEEAAAMEAKPANPQLCDSLILWVSGAGFPSTCALHGSAARSPGVASSLSLRSGLSRRRGAFSVRRGRPGARRGHLWAPRHCRGDGGDGRGLGPPALWGGRGGQQPAGWGSCQVL